MKIAAFDAKKFQRIRRKWDGDKGREEKNTTFISQLGIGVTIPEPEVFVRHYTEASQNLRQKFNLDYAAPFFSSTYLKDSLSVFQAADLTQQLISAVEPHIESVHCSYITLPVLDEPHVEVGGVRCAKRQVPTTHFIDGLGSAFSYLAALSYVWAHKDTNFRDLTMHIDAFRSNHTMGWDILKGTASLKVFYRGDECNPFISCADIIAFHLDDMLAAKRMMLLTDNVKAVLGTYSFNTTVWFFDSSSKNYYTWRTDRTINTSGHLARPVVFLAMDSMASGDPGQGAGTGPDEPSTKRPKRDNTILRQTEVYQAALTHAYRKGGCMKLFSASEDQGIVKSGDMFIYVGPRSRSIGTMLYDMADIQVLSGREAIGLVKKSSKTSAN